MSDEPEKRQLTEDVGGDFGFRVVWNWSTSWCDVKVFKITQAGEDGPFFQRGGGFRSSSDVTCDISEAEVYLEGFIKWDGCSELGRPEEFGRLHWCGANGFKMHMALLKYLYCRAMELMPSSEDPWTDNVLPVLKK